MLKIRGWKYGVSMDVGCLDVCLLSSDENGDQLGGVFYDLLVFHDHHHNQLHYYQLHDDYGQLIALSFDVHA